MTILEARRDYAEQPERPKPGEPFVTYCYGWEDGRAVVLVEYDDIENAFPFSQERLVYVNQF